MKTEWFSGPRGEWYRAFHNSTHRGGKLTLSLAAPNEAGGYDLVPLRSGMPPFVTDKLIERPYRFDELAERVKRCPASCPLAAIWKI